jgi:NAD(P)-dependent dehydrogenase (short-subunit alcohol dehydrogenase family)
MAEPVESHRIRRRIVSDASRGVAAITGGGSGLGEAMAVAFAAAGYDVAVLDVDEPRAQATAVRVAALGRASTAVGVDVADPASMADAASAVEAELGPISILCANVGVQQFGAIDRLTADDWHWVLSVNVFGTVNTVTSFLPSLRRAGGSRHIVLTASAAAFQVGPRLGAYTTSKHAVFGFGETLRLELESEGIGVSMLFPAGMATRHLDSSAAARPAELGPSVTLDEDFAALMASTTVTESSVVTPDYAIRNLLADLENNEPYIFTHGDYRAEVVSRNEAILKAFDRQAR